VEHAAPLLVVVGPFEQNSFIIAELKGIFEFVEVEVRINMVTRTVWLFFPWNGQNPIIFTPQSVLFRVYIQVALSYR